MQNYTLDQDDIDILNNANSDIFIDSVKGVVGSSMGDGQNIQVVARTGYKFSYESNGESSVVFVMRSSTGTKYINLELNEDDTVATYEEPYVDNFIYIRMLVRTIVDVPEVVGSNNVYLINDSSLKKINNARLQYNDENDNAVSFDYGNYILSVLELPFTIPSELIIATNNVMLGSFDTNVEGELLKNDVINIDLGSISVTGHNNSFLDYKNTIALLHLPRTEPINIDLEYVINQTLEISYSIDCYTGNATINIKSTKTNEVIITKIVSLGINVPYGTDNTSVNNINIDVGGDNGVIVPFIEIIKDDVLFKDALFNTPIKEEGILNNKEGFIIVENIRLESSAMRDYKEDINNLLSGGVIIKKAP